MHIHLAGCVIVENNSILLLHRISKDWYELPGGKIEENETPFQAIKRGETKNAPQLFLRHLSDQNDEIRKPALF